MECMSNGPTITVVATEYQLVQEKAGFSHKDIGKEMAHKQQRNESQDRLRFAGCIPSQLTPRVGELLSDDEHESKN